MDEHQPVEESEFVYRRIHPNFYNAGLPIPVLLEAFRPTRGDTSGISLLRAKFAKPRDTLVGGDSTKVAGYKVARLAVRDLLNLGLTVQPEPTAQGPAGHAIIPQLSWPAYEADKKRLKQILFELAKLASTDIVHN
jgi:hypothetical protein